MRCIAVEKEVVGLVERAYNFSALSALRRADQDKLDAVLCALIGLHRHTAPQAVSIVIGDRNAGYKIAWASADVRARIEVAAVRGGVPIDVEFETVRQVSS